MGLCATWCRESWPCPGYGGWAKWSSKVPSNPNLSVLLCGLLWVMLMRLKFSSLYIVSCTPGEPPPFSYLKKIQEIQGRKTGLEESSWLTVSCMSLLSFCVAWDLERVLYAMLLIFLVGSSACLCGGSDLLYSQFPSSISFPSISSNNSKGIWIMWNNLQSNYSHSVWESKQGDRANT